MSEEEFNELKEKFNTLNDEIDQRIDLNIEIDKKNKIIFSLSVLCALGVFTSSFLFYKNYEYRSLSESNELKYDREYKYNKNLEENYRILDAKYEKLKQKTNMYYDYETDNFYDRGKPKKYVDWNKTNLEPLNKLARETDKRKQELRMLELEERMNRYELDKTLHRY